MTAQGSNSLAEAVKSGDYAALVGLVESGVALNAPSGGLAPLHWAVQRGNLQAVELLLDKGADIELRVTDPHSRCYGMGPLHIACRAANDAIVELLLKRGANPNALNHRNATPLHYVAEAGEYRDGKVRSRCPRVFDLLLSHGCDVNATDLYGETALLSAVVLGDQDFVTKLLDKGAELNTFEGCSPALMRALDMKRHEIVGILESRGAKPIPPAPEEPAA